MFRNAEFKDTLKDVSETPENVARDINSAIPDYKMYWIRNVVPNVKTFCCYLFKHNILILFVLRRLESQWKKMGENLSPKIPYLLADLNRHIETFYVNLDISTQRPYVMQFD